MALPYLTGHRFTPVHLDPDGRVCTDPFFRIKHSIIAVAAQWI